MSSVAQGKVVRDGRRLAFFVVTKDATATIRRHFTGRALATARSVYFEIVEEANTAGSDTLTAARARIAERAGVHVSTLTEYADKLSKVGLLRVERRMVDGVNLPNVWTLVEPQGVLASDEDPSYQATTVLVSGEEGSSSQASPREERALEEREEQQQRVREEPVVVEPFRLPPELDQVASLLEQGGVQILDVSFLVRLAESHPHVDLAEVAKITVRRHRQGGLGRPEAYFRGVATSDKPPTRTRATEAARVPEDQWEVVDAASGLRRAPDGTMLCSTPEQHAARRRILDGDAPVTNAWAEMAGGVG